MKRFLLILICLALIVGIIFGSRNPHSFPTGDGVGYDSAAQSLITSGTYTSEDGQLTARRDPGYAFFLAGVYRIFGINYLLIKFLQLLLFAAISIVVYFLACELDFSEASSRLAAILSALYYPLALYVGYFYTEILFTLILLLSIYFYLRSWKSGSIKLAVLAGLLFGLAVLTRSIIFYFPFALLLLSFVLLRSDWKKVLATAGVFVLTFSFVVTPWMVRNYLLFGRPAVSIQAGSVVFFAAQRMKVSNQDLPKMYLANVFGDYIAAKIFGSYDRIKIEEGDFGEVYESLRKQDLSDDVVDTTVEAMALTEIKQRPLHWLVTVPPLEFLQLITPIFPFETAQGLFNDSGRYAYIPDFLKLTIVLCVRLVHWLFLGLMIFGLVRGRKQWPKLLIIYLLIFYFIGTYSLIHGLPRYILPIMPLGIVFVAYSILTILKKDSIPA